jgi:transposase
MIPRTLELHPSTLKRLVRLRKEAEHDGSYRVAKRLQAVVMNAEGYSSGEIARILKAPRSKASAWLRAYEEHGVEGLLEGQRSGRPSGLNERELRKLADILDSGPAEYGLDMGIWTSPMISWVIEEEFGIEYHPGHVRKILHDIGFSVQRPKRVLARADAAERDRWQRYTYPGIKKKRGRKAGR